MVTFLPTPIGNLQDISFHTLEVLERCEVLLCEDTRVTKKQERFHVLSCPLM